MSNITIIIPSWNGLHLLKICLQSIYCQTYRAIEIILVDNGSVDGTTEWVRRHFPKIRIINFPFNKGFSAAVNEGIRQSCGRYLFLLNNDTELDPFCIEWLVQSADKNPEFASFAPKMIQYARRDRLDGCGDGVWRGGGGYRLGHQEPDGDFWQDPMPVFGACAGAAFYRRSFFEIAGMFDESFFAYMEDVDINFRAVRLGLRCLTVPDARVYHMGGQTTGGKKLNPFIVLRTTDNMIRLVFYNYPQSILIRWWPLIALHFFGWFIRVAWNRQLLPYLKGIQSVIHNMPSILEKRRGWHHRSTISDRQFWHIVTHSERDVLACLIRRRMLLGKPLGWINLYMTMFHCDSIR